MLHVIHCISHVDDKETQKYTVAHAVPTQLTEDPFKDIILLAAQAHFLSESSLYILFIKLQFVNIC